MVRYSDHHSNNGHFLSAIQITIRIADKKSAIQMPGSVRYSDHDLDPGIGHVRYSNGSVNRMAVIRILTVEAKWQSW